MPVPTMLPWLVVPILPAGTHGDDEHHGHHAGRAWAAALGGHQPHRHPLRAQPLQASLRLGLEGWHGRKESHACSCTAVSSLPSSTAHLRWRVQPPCSCSCASLLTCRTGSCRSTWRASGTSRSSCHWWTHASRLMSRWMPPGALANGLAAAVGIAVGCCCCPPCGSSHCCIHHTRLQSLAVTSCASPCHGSVQGH